MKGRATVTTRPAQPLPSSNDALLSYLARLDSRVGADWSEHGIGTLGISVRSFSGFAATRLYRGDPHSASGGKASPLFRLGSLSKVLTTASVLVAAERGLIDPAAPLAQHFPDLRLPVSSPLSTTKLFDLLSHRSIFGRVETTCLKHRDGSYRLPIRAMTGERLLAAVAKGQLNGAGRGRRAFDYSDFGMALAGLAVERASRTRYATFAARDVLRAHGVEGFYATTRAAVPGFAQRMLPGHAVPERTILPLPSRPAALQALDPALGAVASVEALTQFMHLFLSGGIVSHRATQRVGAPRMPFGDTAQRNAYGLGVARFSVGEPIRGDFCLGHLCIFEGFCGFSGFHPATGVTLSILMNTVTLKPWAGGGQRREPNPGGFARTIFAELAGLNGENPPSPNTDPLLLRRRDHQRAVGSGA